MTRTISTVDTAKAMRKQLREDFPGTKFSVVMSKGTAYGWINVSWTNGPTDRQVSTVVSQFESERFSGMDDTYHQVEGSPWNCCGVLTGRHCNSEADAWADRVLASGTDHVRHLLANAEAEFGPDQAAYFAAGRLLRDVDLTGHDLTGDALPDTAGQTS